MNTVNARQRLKLNDAIVEGITVLHIKDAKHRLKQKKFRNIKSRIK